MRAALVLACLLLPGPAAAKPAGERAAVVRLLSGYEWAPDRAALLAAAADPAAVLLSLAGDKAAPRAVRLRALDALGHFPTLRVRGALHRQARAEAAPPEERAHAAAALLFAFGAGAVESVRPLLAPREAPALRLSVADGLVRLGGRSGREAVRRARAAEKDPGVAAELAALLDPRPAVPVLR